MERTSFSVRSVGTSRMQRHLFQSLRPRLLAAIALASLVGVGPAVVGACSESAAPDEPKDSDAGPILQRDATPVDVVDAGPKPPSDATAPPPSCGKYCDLVMKNCTGPQAQYASESDCLAFCKHLPLGSAGDDDVGSVACRLYFAGNAARTNPGAYCTAAGPFGGGVCGDRCTAFCAVALSACSPDAGTPSAYQDKGDCDTACAGFSFKDAGPDSGGETPVGPTSGNTLNCRLYYSRLAAKKPADYCDDLGVQSTSCK
jgi:hypothetical protein